MFYLVLKEEKHFAEMQSQGKHYGVYYWKYFSKTFYDKYFYQEKCFIDSDEKTIKFMTT